MNACCRILTAALLVAGVAAQAKDGLTPQQERMRGCNTKADQKELKGPQRRHFMSACLKGSNGNGHQLTAHQQKNDECNTRAKKLRLQGAEKRGFMSECVKPEREKQETAGEEKAKGCQRRAHERRLDGEERQKYVDACLNG
ncbi:MAG TPA: PsiF family protein [Burkholderiales bacterium]